MTIGMPALARWPDRGSDNDLGGNRDGVSLSGLRLENSPATSGHVLDSNSNEGWLAKITLAGVKSPMALMRRRRTCGVHE